MLIVTDGLQQANIFDLLLQRAQHSKQRQDAEWSRSNKEPQLKASPRTSAVCSLPLAI